MGVTFTPTVRQSFDPLLLDVLLWGPLDDKERDPALREELMELVDKLPEMERRVMEGLFWEQLSRRELGRQMGISRARVKTLLERGLAKLSEELTSGAV